MEQNIEASRQQDTETRTRRKANIKKARKPDTITTLFRRTSVVLYCVAVFLLPVFFLPVPGFSLISAKVLTLAFLLFGSAVTYLLSRYKEKIVLPTTFFVIIGAIITALLLSTVFSSSFKASFIGTTFEVGTFFTMFLGAVFAALSSLIISTRTRFVAFFGAFLGGVGLLALFHLLRFLVGPESLSLGMFEAATATPAGTWFDLSILMGVVYVVSFAVLTIGEVPKRLNSGFATTLIISVLFLSILNFKAVLIVLIVLSAVMLLVSFLKQSMNEKVVPLIATAGLVLFLVFGNAIGGFVNQYLDTDYTMVYPTWQDTGEIVNTNFSNIKNLVLGTGPNTFGYLWQDSRSAEVLASNLWLADFAFGSSMLVTFLVTLGVFGALSVLSLFGYIVWLFVRSQAVQSADTLSQTVFVTSVSAAIFLFVISFVTVFGVVPFMLALAFSGVAVGSAVRLRLVRSSAFAPSSPKDSLVFNIVLVIFCIGIIYTGMTVVARSLYGSAIAEVATLTDTTRVKDIDARLRVASRLERNDLYERTRTELALLEIQSLITIPDEQVTENDMDQFSDAYNRAITSSEKAIMIDPRNYLNWISRGFVMETVALLQLGDNRNENFNSAATAYVQAQKENPTNPEILLIQARLELAQNNVEKSREFVRQAIEMKPNHTSAYTLLANIALGQNDTQGAIAAIEEGVKNNPDSVSLNYHLGHLFYTNKNYRSAIEALNKAISIDRVYANARYFRGLSAFYMGDSAAALRDLEFVYGSNRDNQTLLQVIENIKAGRDALFGIDESAGELPPGAEETLTEGGEEVLNNEEETEEVEDAE